MNVPSITINKVCLSGLNAIALADQLIRAGEHEIVVAGGMESMTNAPHFLPKSREGIKFGDVKLVDSMAYDALFDQFTTQAMGMLTEECNAAAPNLTREEQDAFSARSHERAAGRGRTACSTTRSCRSRSRSARATRSWPPGRGDPAVTPPPSRWASCGPPSSKDGTITAGSSSQISDGACAVVVMSKAKAEELGSSGSPRSARTARSPARTRRCSCSRPPRSSKAVREGGHRGRGHRPRRAQRGVRRRRHRVVPASSASTTTKVNVNGGAIAVGHPVGMSGARIVLHLALELKRRGGGIGAAACAAAAARATP